MEKIKDLNPQRFAGCNTLLNQYSIIGLELLRYEELPAMDLSRAAFRQGVCCVPVEVLESYLEDLLDLEATEESLFIVQERNRQVTSILTVAALLIATIAGFVMAQLAGSLISALALMLAAAIPLGFLVFHYGPKERVIRRLKFARLVSLEVARRRGRGRGATVRSSSLVGGILRPAFQQGRRVSGAAFRWIH